LDSGLIENVVRQGYSRVLVCNKHDSQDISGLLLLKDIAMQFSTVQNTQQLTVKELVEMKGKNMLRVFPDQPLNVLLRTLMTGVQIVLVHDVFSGDSGDPYYKIIGIATLEDVLQEVLGNEMVDESDVYSKYYHFQFSPGSLFFVLFCFVFVLTFSCF
jgi:metal transporter CNNM